MSTFISMFENVERHNVDFHDCKKRKKIGDHNADFHVKMSTFISQNVDSLVKM